MSDQLKVVHIVQEHVINAPRAKVFKAIAEDTNAWWSLVADDVVKLTSEAKVGGHFRGEFKNGGGVHFGTVTDIKPGEYIVLSGPMGWDGPVTGYFSYILEERGQSTLVKLEHRFFGPLSDEAQGNYTEGWNQLLGSDLKDFLEKGKRAR